MTPASPGARLKAFGLDYLVVLGYLAVLAGVGSYLTYGPVGETWTRLMSDSFRADGVAFLVAVLPVTLYFALGEGSETGATWGKRRVGLRVSRTDGERLGLPRSLVRSGIKFAPWQLAHTAMFHIPGFPTSPGEPPGWSVALLSLAWALLAAYFVGLTPLAGRRTLYDIVAGSVVVEARPARRPDRGPRTRGP